MKYIIVYSEGNKVELGRNSFSREIVKVNDEVVSSKNSIIGRVHQFNITENGNKIKCRLVTEMGLHGLVVDFYKNGELIYESPRKGFRLLIYLVITISIVRVIFRYLFT